MRWNSPLRTSRSRTRCDRRRQVSVAWAERWNDNRHQSRISGVEYACDPPSRRQRFRCSPRRAPTRARTRTLPCGTRSVGGRRGRSASSWSASAEIRRSEGTRLPRWTAGGSSGQPPARRPTLPRNDHTHVPVERSSVRAPRRLHARTGRRLVLAELLEELLLLLLPVAAHLGVEIAVKVVGRRAAALFDGRDDGLLVRVSDVALFEDLV